MKTETPEAKRFTRLLDRLLAVPRSEIQHKLKAEKRKKRATKRPASREAAAKD
jgi:hypothetical protein